jgi:xanthine/uracil/vitamin C permease (AzgA family)
MSDFLKINVRDLVKGSVVAVLAVLTSSLVTILESGALPTVEQLKKIGLIALTAGVSYLIKNFLTNSQDEVMKKDPVV